MSARHRLLSRVGSKKHRSASIVTQRLETLRTVGMWLMLVIYVAPLYWMISTSIKDPLTVASVPPELIPAEPTFQAFSMLLSNPAFLRSLFVSAVVATGTMVTTVLLAIPAAYGLSRWVGRGRDVIGVTFISAQLLPAIVVATPLFIIFSQYGLTNSFAGLIIAISTITVPFAVIILRPFMDGVPYELEEAAQLDGATPLRILWSVIGPLIMPGVITVGALTFIIAWGDLVFGLTLITNIDYRPITVALTEFVAEFGTRWDLMMAAAAVVAAPIIVIYLLLQRLIVSGLTEGAER